MSQDYFRGLLTQDLELANVTLTTIPYDEGCSCGLGASKAPEAFGLTSKMVLELVLAIFENLNVRAFDIVEVSPQLDVNDITSWLALKTLYEIFNILK